MGSLYHDGFQVGVNVCVYVCVLVDNIPSTYMPYIHTFIFRTLVGEWKNFQNDLDRFKGGLALPTQSIQVAQSGCSAFVLFLQLAI